MNLNEELKKVNDSQTFITFLELLKQNFILANQEWEIRSVADYLDSTIAWIQDSNFQPQDNFWKDLAKVLVAGKIYE